MKRLLITFTLLIVIYKYSLSQKIECGISGGINVYSCTNANYLFNNNILGDWGGEYKYMIGSFINYYPNSLNNLVVEGSLYLSNKMDITVPIFLNLFLNNKMTNLLGIGISQYYGTFDQLGLIKNKTNYCFVGVQAIRKWSIYKSNFSTSISFNIGPATTEILEMHAGGDSYVSVRYYSLSINLKYLIK